MNQKSNHDKIKLSAAEILKWKNTMLTFKEYIQYKYILIVLNCTLFKESQFQEILCLLLKYI